MNKLNLNVKVNTTISNILKRNDKLFEMQDQHNTTYTCKYMIIATGIAEPNVPSFIGKHNINAFQLLMFESTCISNSDKTWRSAMVGRVWLKTKQ